MPAPVQENPQGIAAADQDIEPDIKLVTVQEERLVDVPGSVVLVHPSSEKRFGHKTPKA